MDFAEEVILRNNFFNKTQKDGDQLPLRNDSPPIYYLLDYSIFLYTSETPSPLSGLALASSKNAKTSSPVQFHGVTQDFSKSLYPKETTYILWRWRSPNHIPAIYFLSFFHRHVCDNNI